VECSEISSNSSLAIPGTGKPSFNVSRETRKLSPYMGQMMGSVRWRIIPPMLHRVTNLQIGGTWMFHVKQRGVQLKWTPKAGHRLKVER
jgi:hypothetical protein